MDEIENRLKELNRENLENIIYGTTIGLSVQQQEIYEDERNKRNSGSF